MTKERPQPKSEIIIEVLPITKVLFITTHSDKAKRWIESEAPYFGRLSPPSTAVREYTLFLERGYDAEEVRAYLEEGRKQTSTCSIGTDGLRIES